MKDDDRFQKKSKGPGFLLPGICFAVVLALLTGFLLTKNSGRPLDDTAPAKVARLAVGQDPEQNEDKTPAQDGLIRSFKHDDAVFRAVFRAVFNADESRLLTFSRDRTARLWDLEQGEPLVVFRHDDEVKGAIFSSDESHSHLERRRNGAAVGREAG